MIKLLVVVCCVATAIQAAPSKYTTKYDNVDVEEILKNDRLLSSYFKCLMDMGKCTADGEELKRVLPDALANKCEDCSEKQKEGSKKVIKYMIENKSDMWKELEAKYDPQATYREIYKDEAQTLNIEI